MFDVGNRSGNPAVLEFRDHLKVGDKFARVWPAQHTAEEYTFRGFIAGGVRAVSCALAEDAAEELRDRATVTVPFGEVFPPQIDVALSLWRNDLKDGTAVWVQGPFDRDSWEGTFRRWSEARDNAVVQRENPAKEDTYVARHRLFPSLPIGVVDMSEPAHRFTIPDRKWAARRSAR